MYSLKQRNLHVVRIDKGEDLYSLSFEWFFNLQQQDILIIDWGKGGYKEEDGSQ